MWLEERDDPMNSMAKGSDLRSVGVTPGGMEADLGMGADLGGGDMGGDMGAAPAGEAGGAAPAAAPGPAAAPPPA
jgi:hypothetical protein